LNKPKYINEVGESLAGRLNISLSDAQDYVIEQAKLGTIKYSFETYPHRVVYYASK
jgi:hypothetical protein